MIPLTTRQIELLKKYSAPFEGVKRQLDKVSENPTADVHKIKIDEYYGNLLLADLVHYSKTIDDDILLEEIDDLYSVIEYGIGS
jgi:hypothetical protein